MRVELDLDAASAAHPIRGRLRGERGEWREFTGWTQLVAEIELLRSPPQALAQDSPPAGDDGEGEAR